MGWSIGFDHNWNRDIGYGVPAICDHPGCDVEIDRGLSYVCGGQPHGGDDGCGLFFCSQHLWPIYCERCRGGKEPFDAKPDVKNWLAHKLTHESWEEWRKANPKQVQELQEKLKEEGCLKKEIWL